MKRLFFHSLFYLFAVSGFAQSSLPKREADSLWNVWTDNLSPDTLRSEALHTYAWEGYLFSQPDSAFYFSSLNYAFCKANNLQKRMGLALYAQGVASSIQGQYAEAIKYFLESQVVNEAIGNKRGIAIALGGVGNVYNDWGEFELARFYYQRTLEIQLEIKNKKGIAVAYNNLGNSSLHLGDFVSALEYYKMALDRYKELNNKKGSAETMNNMGIVYDELRQTDLAMEYYSNSLAIKLEIGDDLGASKSLNNLGQLFTTLKDYNVAMSYFQEALELKKSVGDLKGEAMVYNNIGSLFMNKRQLVEAELYFTEALDISVELADIPAQSQTLNNLGMCSLFAGDYLTALELSVRAYQLAYDVSSISLMRDAALANYKACIKLNRIDEANSWLNVLTKVLLKSLYANFFSITEAEKETYFAGMEIGFGRYYDFTVNYSNVFASLPDSAYNIALRNKGITLKSSSVMRTAILNSGNESLIADYDRWISLKRNITELYSSGGDTHDLESEANELELKLIKNSSAFGDFERTKNLDWKALQAVLRQDECAIEFVHFESQIDTATQVLYAALLIKPGIEHPAVIRLCTESELTKIIGGVQGNNLSFVNKIYGTREAPNTALYQKVWEPLEPFLKTVNTVYYSPSGLLHKVSFASIAQGQNVFLSDRFRFRQMSSTGLLATNENSDLSEDESFFLMGGVNYNSAITEKEIWSYLPGSLQETNLIDGFLQKKKYSVQHLVGEQASEDNFKKQITSAGIIHIATHGFFFADPDDVQEELKAESENKEELIFRGNDLSLERGNSNYANWSFVNNKNPLMRSGIVLAHGNDVWTRQALTEGEDGILTAQEVSTLDLRNTKLVVLSACETGLGDIKGSEGVFGLQRAFKMAGVKYLIMSLWQVPDKETSEFMILFYKNLIKLKDIPSAFQKTQKVMREKYDPYYWGAFVLIE